MEAGLQICGKPFDRVDRVIHGSFARRRLTGDHHAEKVAEVVVRQRHIADHQTSLDHHASLDRSRDFGQFVPPFPSLRFGPHTRWYVPAIERRFVHANAG